MSLYRICLVAVCTFVLAGSALAATSPWQWTPAQAASAVRSDTQLVYTDDYGLDMELSKLTCRGVGKAVQRRFLSFRCTATYLRRGTVIRPDEVKTAILQVKIRRVGRGSVCAAVDIVPVSCLAKGTRAPGSMREAYAAYRQTTQASPSDDECYAHGSGFYSCWWEDSTGRHRATITFAPRPEVKVLS
jgi:hypothetical protein